MPTPAQTPPADAAAPDADFDLASLDVGEPIDDAPQPAPAARPQPAPKHSAMSLRLAREYGLDPARFSPEDLDAEVASTTAWLAREHRQRQVESRAPEPRPAPPQGGNVATPEDDLGLDPGRYEPELIDAFRKLSGENKALREKLSGIETRDQHRERLTQDDALDAAFEALSESYQRFVGKGSMAEILNTPEATRRNSVYAAARIDWSKDTPRVVARKIKAAAETIYGPAVSQPAAAPAGQPSLYGAPSASPQGAGTPPSVQPADAAPARPRRPDGTFMSDAEIEALAARQRWNDAALARPTARAGSQEPPGVERAKRAVGEQIRQMAAEGGAPADDMNGFLP